MANFLFWSVLREMRGGRESLLCMVPVKSLADWDFFFLNLHRFFAQFVTPILYLNSVMWVPVNSSVDWRSPFYYQFHNLRLRQNLSYLSIYKIVFLVLYILKIKLFTTCIPSNLSNWDWDFVNTQFWYFEEIVKIVIIYIWSLEEF